MEKRLQLRDTIRDDETAKRGGLRVRQEDNGKQIQLPTYKYIGKKRKLGYIKF